MPKGSERNSLRPKVVYVLYVLYCKQGLNFRQVGNAMQYDKLKRRDKEISIFIDNFLETGPTFSSFILQFRFDWSET